MEYSILSDLNQHLPVDAVGTGRVDQAHDTFELGRHLQDRIPDPFFSVCGQGVQDGSNPKEACRMMVMADVPDGCQLKEISV